MDFTINEKLYYKLSDFCEYNQLDFNDYVEECIVKQFNIDRYGDLNDIFQHNEEIDAVNEVKLDENKEHLIIIQESNRETIIPLEKLPIEELKRVWVCKNCLTSKEKNDTNTNNDKNITETISKKNTMTSQKEVNENVIKEELTKPQKPKKRVLKTK